MKRALLAISLATALGGCTLIGGIQGAQSARAHNEARERAIDRGDPKPPAPANVAGRSLGYGMLGLAIDVVLVVLVGPKLLPHE